MATKATQIKRGNDILHPETDTSQVVGLADWAKQPTKPTYTASEVGALPSSTEIPSKTSDLMNDSDYTTQTYVDGLVGNILTILTSI